MNIINIIKNSLWIIFSFITFINGFGFIYMGITTNNKNWILEGFVYELPWILIVLFTIIPNLASLFYLGIIGMALQIVSIVRSIWADYKYIKRLDANENRKYFP